MPTRGKLSLGKSPRESESRGGRFWSDSPQFPSPRQSWLIWRRVPSPRAGTRSAAMLLGGLRPLLFLWISVLLLSAGSLTPVPTPGLPAPRAPRRDFSHWPRATSGPEANTCAHGAPGRPSHRRPFPGHKPLVFKAVFSPDE